MRIRLALILWFATLACGATICRGQTPTREDATTPSANRADEAFAKAYSAEAAAKFLDQASLNWTATRKCFTCHTNYAYLIARPHIAVAGDAHQRMRKSLEELVEDRWQTEGPRWDAEVIMSAAVLALNDRATSGTLHATTRKALDRMWTVQRDDGGVDWLKCDWPPMESDDHYGATMMAIAVGAAGEPYRNTEVAQHGLRKLKTYFTQHPAEHLHHEAMLLWANSMVPGIIDEKTQASSVDRLLSLQQADGGWTLATLGTWSRKDDAAQDETTSDGYATGFVVFVLRQAGVASDHAQIERGIRWLKSHQRASGRWFTRSLSNDKHHFISHAGTAFAVLAIAACEAPNSNQE